MKRFQCFVDEQGSLKAFLEVKVSSLLYGGMKGSYVLYADVAALCALDALVPV